MVHKQKKFSPLSLIIGISSLSFLLIPIFYNSVIPAIGVTEKVTDRELEEKDLEQIATLISVKITSETNGGSGVLIAKGDNIYTILTNNHVVENQQKITIQTSDGTTHQAEKVNIDSDEQDVALLQFSSEIDYQIATLNNSQNITKGDRVFISGFPFRDKTSESRELIFRNGRVSFILQKALKAGYKIGYVTEENAVEKGMSGGAILDRSGKLIGINGIHANPLWGNPYVYENGDTPNEELRAKMSLSNWGVPIEILAQYASNIAIDIPTEQLSAIAESEGKTTVKTSDLTSKINAKAKEISVLISWSTPTGLSNGSGVLIAQEGNTYHVLTAEHVVSNANESLKIVTHDGREYQIKSQKTFDGADLALLEFTSNESYQVATIGDYYRGLEDRVIFVSGWSSSKQTVAENIEDDREFNAGYLLGYHSVNLARDNRSFNNGWELVYSNFTSVGMSGSPLLDIEGNLIGIHAGSESDQGRISPVPQENNREAIHDIGYSLGVSVKTVLAKLKQSQTDLGLDPQNSAPQKLSDVKQDNLIRSLVDLNPPTADADEVAWLNHGNKLWRLRDYDKSLQAYEKAIDIKPDFHKAWYAHGWALMRQKNYTQAKVSFNKAIEYVGESDYEAATLAWRQLGDAHWYLGDYEESTEAFKKAIHYRRDDFIVYQWLSDSFSQSGRYTEAIKALEEAISLNSKSYNGYLRLADVLSSTQKHEAAISTINKAIELEPGNSINYLRRGGYYSSQNNYELALADINKAIEIEPNFADAYSSRGYVRALQENESQFESDFERALSLQPESSWIYQSRGDGYIALGSIDKGIQDYDTAINLDSNFAHQFYNSRGLALNSQGEYDKAIADFNRAIELKPKINIYYQNRGISYVYQEKYELALTDLNKAIDIEPNNSLSYAWRGFTHAKMGNDELFNSDFDQAFSLDAESIWLYTMRGDSYFALEEIDKGVQDYDKAISLNPKLAHQYHNWRGDQFYGLEDYESAIADYTKAIELQPDEVLYYTNRGNSYAKAGNTPKLIQNYDKAISLNPELAHQYHNWRGNQFYSLEDYESAIADFTKAVELKPDEPQYYINRGNSYAKAGNIQQLTEDYNTAISLNSDLAHEYHNQRGNQFYNLEDYESAISDYTKAIELKPDIALYYNERGNQFHSLGDYESAIADYTKAIELKPDIALYRLNLGYVYSNLKDYENAIANYTKVIELEPNNVDHYVNRGQFYNNLENYQLAVADFNKALSIEPENINAHTSRGFAYYKLEEYEAAIPDITFAIQNADFSNNNEALEGIYISRATARFETGDNEGAYQDLTESIRINPENVTNYEHRARLLTTMGNKEEAKKDWGKAAELYQQQGNTESSQLALEEANKL